MGPKALKQIQLNRAGVFRNYLARLLVARTILANMGKDKQTALQQGNLSQGFVRQREGTK